MVGSVVTGSFVFVFVLKRTFLHCEVTMRCQGLPTQVRLPPTRCSRGESLTSQVKCQRSLLIYHLRPTLTLKAMSDRGLGFVLGSEPLPPCAGLKRGSPDERSYVQLDLVRFGIVKGVWHLHAEVTRGSVLVQSEARAAAAAA